MKAILAALFIALALPSCRAPKPIVQEHTRYAADTLYISRERADTIAVRDSVATDTAGRIIYRERQVWRTKVRTDTLWRTIERTDTIAIALPAKEPESGGGARHFLVLLAFSTVATIIVLRLRR